MALDDKVSDNGIIKEKPEASRPKVRNVLEKDSISSTARSLTRSRTLM